MNLSSRITKYVLRRASTTLSDLERVCASKDIPLADLYSALEKVHKDKRIKVTNLKDGVTYRPATAKEPPSTSHLSWINENYPHRDMLGEPIPFYEPSTDGPTPVWSYETRAFLREQREALKDANMKTYGKKRSRYTKRHP